MAHNEPERSFSFAHHDDDPFDRPLVEQIPGVEARGTVVRKSVGAESAAHSAAVLAAVQEDLVPSPSNERYWGQELGYSRSITATPAEMRGGGGENSYRGGSGQDIGEAGAYMTGVAVSRGGALDSRDPTFLQTPGPPSTPGSNASLPTSSSHRGGSAGAGAGGDRILVDPIVGRYTDNPYNRMSTTYDPVLAQSGWDSVGDVLSDDEGFVPKGAAAASGAGGKGVERAGLMSGGGGASEKTDLLRQKEQKSLRARKWIIIAVAVILCLAIVAGVTAGVLVSRKKSSNSADSADSADSASPKGQAAGGGGLNLSADEDVKVNGDLDKNSPEIKKLLKTPGLHKVFHGMDYTPLGGIYPECLTWPPTQNNVTRDVAVLSLLTDKVRLYGNDCNQTEMVLHAIDQLDVDMGVWAGVWLDKNSSTTTRQLNRLYTLLRDEQHHDKWLGVAVGNEVLFAETLTEPELFDIIKEVKANVTKMGYDVPVGTSDLGSNWNVQMAGQVDILMANVHPFFAGVTVDDAANWTYTFFQNNDVVLTKGLTNKPRVMISEVGWPSGGGKNNGSVAGINEMNQFMGDFVCQENTKGTEYFWFSAFDEPWKVRFNTPGKHWEDKWGLLDVNRVLKKGLNIPSCN